ncbi:MAG: DUF3726 domain-containing protein [Roseicyclus sp.]|nr:DUF3726 domain-containing protein [Roseicyclus sp.]MBO6624121.1 DUF3726 domain-containing protein [Roseicyclus sp.]MBO6923225.1 DUF3726 domain-containing protein [Roseicyclus sp.]
MITPSLNETARRMRDAARGAGWPDGIATEIGHAAAWLAAQGADGVGAALAAIKEPSGPVDARQNGDALWYIGPAPVAVAGPAALDLLFAGEGPVHVTFTHHRTLFLGLAGWASAQTGYRIGLEGAITVQIEAGHLLDAPHTDPTRRDLVLTARPGLPGAPLSCGRHAPSSDDWEDALQLAGRTLVPATAASRAFGAGAGTGDGD